MYQVESIEYSRGRIRLPQHNLSANQRRAKETDLSFHRNPQLSSKS